MKSGPPRTCPSGLTAFSAHFSTSTPVREPAGLPWSWAQKGTASLLGPLACAVEAEGAVPACSGHFERSVCSLLHHKLAGPWDRTLGGPRNCTFTVHLGLPGMVVSDHVGSWGHEPLVILHPSGDSDSLCHLSLWLALPSGSVQDSEHFPAG